MKTVLLFVGVLLTLFTSKAQNSNLPAPTANLQTLAGGSYIIAMDNSLQSNTAGHFNLKAYGLVVHLLNNNVKIKWSIKAGKSKDGIDFTANTEQIQPVLVSGGIARNFKAGPFVIYAADTTGVASLIAGYYTSSSLIGNDRPKVYRTTTSIPNVDIRYDMTGFKPKAQILNDDNNTDIHVANMTNCGVTTTNYGVGPAVNLYTRCFTFASEPHSSNATPIILNAIKSFVEKGGNFLAQCRGVESFENSLNGRFQTTNGIKVVNNSVDPVATIYPNADLAFSQYDGVFDIKQSGSVLNWILEPGSTYKNNTHNHATGGTMANQTPIGASVAKLTSAGLPGGLVFYLGGHQYSSIEDIESINGIRMYMNAFLTPVAINSNCTTGSVLANPLPVKLISFTATLNNTNADLKWTTVSEINLSHFIIEKSTDGINFNDAGMVFANGNATDMMQYSFSDNLINTSAKVIYYRLRSVDADSKNELSATRIIRTGKQIETVGIVAYPNPVTNELRITIPASWQNKKVVYELFDGNGRSAKKTETAAGSQTEILNVSGLTAGLYIVRVSCDGEITQQKIIKK